MLQFDSLPTDIWFSIINLLPIKQVLSMERTSKRVHQLVQPAVRQKCTKLLQSPKYHSRERIRRNFSLVMTLAKKDILPSVHQQLWALEAAIECNTTEAIDTIKARFHLIPQMYNLCIQRFQNGSNLDMQRMAVEFMQFLDSKGITHQHLDIKGKTVDEIIDVWSPVDYESSDEFPKLAQVNDFEGCQRLLSLGRIRIDLASCLESETISLKMVRFIVEQPGINLNRGFRQWSYLQVPLIVAGSTNNVDVFKLLLEQPGMDVNQPEILETVLFTVCRIGRLEIVKLLLERPEIDVNIANLEGYTAIMCAIFNGHMDIVKLLASHPDINLNYSRKRDKKTLLIFACEKDDVEIVDWLLKLPEIEINMTDLDLRTALHHAASRGYLEIVERLLRHPEINVNQADDDDNTALMLAAKEGHCSIIEILLGHPSIDFDAVGLCKSARWDALQILVKRYGFDLKPLAKDIDRASEVLTEASSNGQFEFVQLLLNYIPIGMEGIDKVYGRTLLKACSYGNFYVVEMLLNHPDMNILLAQDNYDTTALMAACNANSVDIVQLLLKHPQLDVNQADKDGNTALMFACKNGCVDIVELLLSQPGIDVNLFNGRGETALTLSKHMEIADLLLAHTGIDVNHANLNGQTALMRASWNVLSMKIMKLLLKHPEIDVNRVDKNGSTALILAAEHCSLYTMELLLSHPGINVNHENNRGYTALMHVCEDRIIRAVELLLGHPDIKLNQDNKRCVTALLKASRGN